MGACFVVRELTRTHVLTSPLAYPHCYVPTLRMRNFYEHIFPITIQDGCGGSRDIFAFLQEHLGAEGATFAGSFDLPFIALYEESRRGHTNLPALFEHASDREAWMESDLDLAAGEGE